MQDTTLQVIDIQALDVNEDAEHLILGMITATQAPTPFAGPDGQAVVLTIPTGIFKVPLNKQAALDLIASLQEQVDKLPDPKRPSGLVVPGSMAEAEHTAQSLQRFK